MTPEEKLILDVEQLFNFLPRRVLRFMGININKIATKIAKISQEYVEEKTKPKPFNYKDIKYGPNKGPGTGGWGGGNYKE